METSCKRPPPATQHALVSQNVQLQMLRLFKFVVVAVVLLRLKSLVSFWLAANFLLLLYVLYRVTKKRTYPVSHVLPKKRKFNFLAEKPWLEQVSQLRVDPKSISSPAFEKAPSISQALADLTESIMREFVDSWFSRISADSLFQDSVRFELKHVFSSVGSRLASMNISHTLVHKIIPIITDQYTQFISINHSHDAVYSMESKSEIAKKFRSGKIHGGVSVGTSGVSSRQNEKEHLRQKIKALLPYLLSSRERSNKLANSLLTEILACAVLTNVFAVLSEGDFLNQIIVKVVGANLQHRNQVKRLREALQQHTTQVQDATLRLDKIKFPSLKSPISPECVAAWAIQISKCESEAELDRIRDTLLVKQSSLSPSSDTYLHDRGSISKIISGLPNSADKRPKSQNLESILSDPKRAAIFREFVRGFKHEADVDLWLDIESMRAPLEGTEIADVPLSLEFSNKDDILRIAERYFSLPSLTIDDLIRNDVLSYTRKASMNDADSYQRARSALFDLQANLFEHMKSAHFNRFKSSNRFGDLESMSPKKSKSNRVVSTAFPRAEAFDHEEEDYTAYTGEEPSTVSPVVVKAVESAFEKIMSVNSGIGDQNLPAPFKNFKELVSDTAPLTSSRAPLFSDSALAVSASTSTLQRDSSHRLSALFEEDSDSDQDESSLSDSSESDLSTRRDLSNSELLLAAPGDLSLAEKIAAIDKEIENLTEQNEILTPLLKKAELTNNIAELKILKRSNASLEKEINSKELQKQQYIVQENDNSLYGKSKVSIQSCVFGKDENLTYVMYVIEVQKFSAQDSNEVVAGWIVARRFSQFHKLNEYLKRRYAGVCDIKFPKKNVSYLTFQKSQQIETRKPLLEKYLQELLMIPAVCSDPAFRSFLSSETFSVGKSRSGPKQKIDRMFSQIYKDLGGGSSLKISVPYKTHQNEEMLLNIREMEKELKEFDDVRKEDASREPFVKPISDLLLTVFDLSKSNWLRGRALLVILQQVLGSTIQKTITSHIERVVRSESTVANVIYSVQNMLFPNGKFRDSPEIRTKSEQLITRKEANTILQIYMSETCSKVFGLKNTEQACENIFEMLQNDFLNEGLMFEILDVLLETIFPELEENTK